MSVSPLSQIVMGITDSPSSNDIDMDVTGNICLIPRDDSGSSSYAPSSQSSPVWTPLDNGQIVLPILILKPNGQPASVNWNLISTLLDQARRGAGFNGISQGNAVLRFKLNGESNWTYVDVIDGHLTPGEIRMADGRMAGIATLDVLPYSRGAPVTYGPWTVANGDRDQAYCLTITGSAGTFTLTKGANTTSGLAFGASASAIQTALQGLASIGAGNCLVWGPAGSPFIVQFAGSLAAQNITLTTNGGSGGCTATLTPATSGALWIPGSPGTRKSAIRIQATDVSTVSNIVKWKWGRFDGPLLVPSDFPPVAGVVAQSPGVDDTTAPAGRRGHHSRLATPTSSFQAIARFTSPTVGRHNGRKRAWIMARDYAATLGAPYNATVTTASGGGNLPPASYQYALTPYDGSGNRGLPVFLPPITAVLLNTAGTGAAATTLFMYDDFESQEFLNWNPGPANLFPSITSGTSSCVVDTTSKFAGTYGAHLKSDATAATTGSGIDQALARVAPAATSTKAYSFQARIDVITASSVVAGFQRLIFWAQIGTTYVGLGNSGGGGTSNWYAMSTTNQYSNSSAPLAKAGTAQTLSSGFHLVEITLEDDGAEIGWRLAVDGVVWGGGVLATAAINAFAVDAFALSDGTTIGHWEIYADNVALMDGYIGGITISGGCVNTLNWTAGLNDAGFDLGYMLNTGNWYNVDIGLVTTYSHTTLVPTGVAIKAPPSVDKSQQPALLRLGSALNVPDPTFQYSPAFLPQKSNGIWELMGGVELACPPAASRLGVQSESWLIQAEGARASGSQHIDVAFIAFFDAMLEAPEVEALVVSALRNWDFDSRSDQNKSVVVRSTSDQSAQEQASVSQAMMFGEGSGWLIPIMEISDGAGSYKADAATTLASLTVTVTPLNDLTQGS